MLTLTLHQSEPVYRLRLPVRIQYAAGSAEVIPVRTETPITSAVIRKARRVAGVEFEAHLFRAGTSRQIAKDPALARRELESALRCAVRSPSRLVQAASGLHDAEVGRWAAQSVLLLEKSLGQETAASSEAKQYLEANRK